VLPLVNETIVAEFEETEPGTSAGSPLDHLTV
jgi:hypothetical protein